MKNAYNQGLECDHGDDDGGDDGVSPKDVGHNIYILAHQVSHFTSCIILLILSVVFCAMACYFQVLVSSFLQHLPPCSGSRRGKCSPNSQLCSQSYARG